MGYTAIMKYYIFAFAVVGYFIATIASLFFFLVFIYCGMLEASLISLLIGVATFVPAFFGGLILDKIDF